MNFLFIINPVSGPANSRKNIKDLIFKSIGKNADIQITSRAGQASEIAKEALRRGFENIIAVGGDGTMNEVARVLVNKRANFGLIPMGSGNGFARSLGIPLNHQKALDTIKRKKIKKIDAGIANGVYFFVVSGIGFEANVARRFRESKKRGPVPYFFNGLKELLVYQYPAFTISSKEFSSKINPLTIAVANAPQYGNNALISPDSDMCDGFLDTCILSKMSIIKSVKALKLLFNGQITNLESYTSFTSNQITITSNQKNCFHTDGEVNEASDKIIFEIVPNALNVIC